MAEIKLRFSNDDYNGSKIIDLEGYNYQSVYATRADLSNLINGKNGQYEDFKEIFKRPGIYILKSLDDTNERIYIGKAYNKPLANRLQAHNRNDKIEFSEVIAFTSINKSFPINTEYVESRLVEIAKKCKNSILENNQQPQLPPDLTSSEKKQMEKFIGYINIILPIAGYKCLMSNIGKNIIKKNGNQIIFTLKNYDATMVQSDNPTGFYVIKGSKAKKVTQASLIKTYVNIKQKCINDRILIDKGSYYEFKEDTLFQSPSAAASVILGVQTQGTIYWIDKKNNNKTWKEYQ
jgi:hypothetical protein